MPLKLVIGVVLIARGIGHSLGYFPLFGWAKAAGRSGNSWLLTGPLGATASNVVALVLWTVPLIGFLLVGLGVLGLVVPAEWIRPLAIASALVSIAGLILYPDAFPVLTSKIGAVAIDAFVLWAVLVAHWPSSDIVPG